MKFKHLIILALCFISLNVFASRIHSYHTNVKPSLSVKAPGPCEIELINSSYDDVYVHVAYDDGGIDEVILYRNDKQYIDLNYPVGSPYCQPGALVQIHTLDGILIFNQYVLRGKTVHVTPALLKAFKLTK